MSPELERSVCETPAMRVTFDRDANMGYIRLAAIEDGAAVQQVPVHEPGRDSARFVLDFDYEGRLLGIEIFDATESLPWEVLEEADAPGP